MSCFKITVFSGSLKKYVSESWQGRHRKVTQQRKEYSSLGMVTIAMTPCGRSFVMKLSAGHCTYDPNTTTLCKTNTVTSISRVRKQSWGTWLSCSKNLDLNLNVTLSLELHLPMSWVLLRAHKEVVTCLSTIFPNYEEPPQSLEYHRAPAPWNYFWVTYQQQCCTNHRSLQVVWSRQGAQVSLHSTPSPLGKLSLPLQSDGDGMGSILQHQIHVPSLSPECSVQGWVHALIQVNQNLI